MKYEELGNTGIQVSQICLGTMTFGQQNTEADGHQQLDYAIEQGINFIDTAELYAVPAFENTYGKTEEIIGTWLKNRKDRDKLIIASKICGPNPNMPWIRGGKSFYTDSNIDDAINDSLKRLQTDYIDLYQLHWPERKTNFFGKRGYTGNNGEENYVEDFKRILESLQKHIDAGKIKHIGISNETTWAMMKYLSYSEKHDLPRIQSIQNPYNLINRLFEVGSSEVSIQEKVGLLAYSPLGFGALSGKYLNGKMPKGARYTEFPNFNRYHKPNAVKATEAYAELAKELDISLATLALAFINNRPFLTANIIGATNMGQLKENIKSIDFKWTDEIEKKVNEIHETIPNPAP